MRRIKKDDVLYVKSIDRLGRNYDEILAQWRYLTKDREVDIVLQVLSFVAENERSNIRQRQAEGIAAAKARGIRLGRPPKPLPKSFFLAVERWKKGELSGKQAAEACSMPVSSFYYRAKKQEKEKPL